MNNYIGNISTIIKTILVVFAGWCIGYFASLGLDLGISETDLAELFFMLVCLAGAYIDARYPNTFKFLDNAPSFDVEDENDLVNEEYIYEDEI